MPQRWRRISRRHFKKFRGKSRSLRSLTNLPRKHRTERSSAGAIRSATRRVFRLRRKIDARSARGVNFAVHAAEIYGFEFISRLRRETLRGVFRREASNLRRGNSFVPSFSINGVPKRRKTPFGILMRPVESAGAKQVEGAFSARRFAGNRSREFIQTFCTAGRATAPPLYLPPK